MPLCLGNPGPVEGLIPGRDPSASQRVGPRWSPRPLQPKASNSKTDGAREAWGVKGKPEHGGRQVRGMLAEPFQVPRLQDPSSGKKERYNPRRQLCGGALCGPKADLSFSPSSGTPDGDTDPQRVCQGQETGERKVVPWLLGLLPAPRSLGSGYTHCRCAQNPGRCWKEISWDLVAGSTVIYAGPLHPDCSVVNSNRRKEIFLSWERICFLL